MKSGMKFFVLLAAVALLTLAAPVTAAENAPISPISTGDLATIFELPVEGGQYSPIDLVPVLIPRCSAVNGTTCPARSGPRSCTDVCRNKLSCSCIYFSGAWRWRCDQEC